MRFLLFLLSFPLTLLFSFQSLHASPDNTIANLTPSSYCIGEIHGQNVCNVFENGEPKSLPIGTEGEVVLAQLPQIMIFSIFLGVFLSLFINSHFLYITTKESDYLFYSGFILFFSIWMIASHGYLEYIFESAIVIKTLKVFSFHMGVLSLILFSLRFLNIQKIYPKFFNISYFFIGVGILFFITISLDLNSEPFGEMLLLSFICFYLGIVSFRNKYAPTKYYLLAIGGYLIGLSTEILVMKGVVPSTFYTTEAHLIGFIWEMIFLLLALGYKVRLLQNERNDAISKTQIQEKMLFLKSRQASVGELVGNIAHQWREPLGEIGSIHTNLEATLMLKGSVSNEALLNFIRESYKIIRHLSDTIDVFYRFFKNKKSDKEEFDVCEAITNIQQMVHYSLMVENIMLVYRCEENIIVFWNRNEFANILLNIILNAKDVLIERKIQNPIISIQVSKNDENIIITIEDNGTGIKQEPIDKIFQSGVSSKEHGIGLGLFIVRTIIEQRMGGEISVKNSEQGALFTLSIPQKSNEFKVENMTSSYAMEEDTLERISKLEKKVAQQEETEKTLQKWADIFQHAQWGIAIHVGTSDTFELTNSAFNALYGYTSSDLKNITLPDLFVSESLPILFQAQKEAFEKGYFVFEAIHKSKNGSTFPVSIELIVVKDDNGEILYHIVNIWDLTEKKEIVDALKTSEEAFRAMVENSPDAIMRYDRECRRTYINPLGLLLMGKSKEELLGKTPREFSPLPDLEEFEKAFYTVLNEKKEVRIDGLFCTSTGEKRWGEERIVPELNIQGEVVSVLVIGRDITELRKANERLLLKAFALNKTSETIFLIDEKSNFHYLNESAYQSLGYEEEELMQLNVISIDPNMSQEKWIEHWNDMKQLRSVSILTHHQKKDGTIFPIEVSANYFEYKGIGYNLAVAKDITERLEAEKRKDDEKMRLFFERQLVGMAITSPEKGWLHVNDKLCDMLGYTLEELQKMTWAEITYPDDLAGDIEQFDRLLLGEIEDYMLEKRFVRKNKTLVYTNLAVSCVRNDDRSVNYVLALLEDITEQKRAYEALANKERELRSLTDNIPDNVARWDTQGRYLYINPTQEKLLNITLADVVGKSIRELFPHIDFSILENAIVKTVATKESVTIHQQVPDDNGKILIHDINLVPEFDENKEVISVLGIGRDMTAIYHLQDEIAIKEEQFRTLVENLPDNVIRYDTQCRAVYVSSTMARIFGEDAVLTMMDKTPFEADTDPSSVTMDNQQTSHYQQTIERVLATGEKDEIIIDMSSPFGEILYHQIRFVPERNRDGQISGLLAIGTDITEQKKAEEEIKTLNASLEKKVVERTAEISKKEREFRTLAENMPDFLVRYDSVGRRTYVNPPLCKYFALSSEELIGFTPEGKPIVGMPPELHEKVQFVLQTAQKTELELMNDIDGIKCWWNIIFVPEFDEEGNISGVISIGHDITSVKEAQFKIAEENEKFSKLFISSPAAVSVTSIDRNMYLEVNESFLSFTKYTREEVVGKSSADLQLFANTEERAEFFRMVLEDGGVRGFEFEYQAKDGTTGYGIAYATLLYINGEKCVLAHSYDINARKQLELVNISLNSTSEAVYITDNDFSIVYVNDGACNMLGYTKEELLSMKVYELDALHSADSLLEFQSNVQLERQINFETKHKMKNGNIINVEILGSSFMFHNKPVELAVVKDITAKKGFEEKLKLLEIAINNASDAVYIVGNDRYIKYVSDTACRMLGYTIDEFLNMKVEDIDPHMSVEEIDNVKVQLDFKENTIFQTKHRAKNGNIFDVEITVTRFVYNDTDLRLSIVKDIAERKRYEQEIQELNKTLEHKVMIRTKELQKDITKR